ncbi:MAG: hypothetical protein IKI75_08875 [Lachnospiraceae bacterium]|nr:hypothetical protein [Lachnospiraceae bacterium]
MSDNGISKSKQKRQAQASARAEQKKKKVIATFWAVFIPLLLVAAVVAAIVAYQLSKLDYSRYLNKDGKIKDVRAADYVDVNLAGFSYAKDDISADEATIESDISYALSQHAYVSDDPELEAGYGDKVQLSYTAQMDGAAYGDPVDNRDMTVGNEEIAAEFDDALLGLHAGDETDVDVTYPADSENTELAGKTVSYHISFKGVYQDPEFTDEFVKEYYSENATTAEGYRQYLRDKHYNDNLKSEVEKSLSLNSVVKAYPDKYMNNLKRVYEAEDRANINNFYMMYTGQEAQGETWELYGMSSKEEYDAELANRAKEGAAEDMELQFIADSAGISVSEEEIKDFYAGQGMDDATYQSRKAETGAGYMAQAALKDKVIKHLCSVAVVTETTTVVD